MARIVFNRQTGEFVMSASDRKAVEAEIRRIFRSGDRAMHEAMGTLLLGPIRAIAAYEEWTQHFFVKKNVQPGEIVRIIKPSYIATAFYTSPSGQVMFVRPGRRYGTVEWTAIDAGVEFHWDDVEVAGWNYVEQHIRDAGDELARKRDEMGQSVVDAAINSMSGHVVQVAGSMTKSAVDTILRAAADGPFGLSFAIVNPSRVMDMTDWSWSVTTPLWQLSVERGEEILRNGWIGNYGGLRWYVYKSVPRNKVYFGTDPVNIGWALQMGGTRRASDSDIVKKLDRHTFDEKHCRTVENATGLYRIDIV